MTNYQMSFQKRLPIDYSTESQVLLVRKLICAIFIKKSTFWFEEVGVLAGKGSLTKK